MPERGVRKQACAFAARCGARTRLSSARSLTPRFEACELHRWPPRGGQQHRAAQGRGKAAASYKGGLMKWVEERRGCLQVRWDGEPEDKGMLNAGGSLCANRTETLTTCPWPLWPSSNMSHDVNEAQTVLSKHKKTDRKRKYRYSLFDFFIYFFFTPSPSLHTSCWINSVKEVLLIGKDRESICLLREAPWVSAVSRIEKLFILKKICLNVTLFIYLFIFKSTASINGSAGIQKN